MTTNANPESGDGIAAQLRVLGQAIRQMERDLFDKIAERDQLIVALHDAGLSLRVIAGLAFLDHTRIRQILDHRSTDRRGKPGVPISRPRPVARAEVEALLTDSTAWMAHWRSVTHDWPHVGAVTEAAARSMAILRRFVTDPDHLSAEEVIEAHDQVMTARSLRPARRLLEGEVQLRERWDDIMARLIVQLTQ
jgi:hypothetical protein